MLDEWIATHELMLADIRRARRWLLIFDSMLALGEVMLIGLCVYWALDGAPDWHRWAFGGAAAVGVVGLAATVRSARVGWIRMQFMELGVLQTLRMAREGQEMDE